MTSTDRMNEPPDAMPIWARLRLNLTPVPFANVTCWVQFSPTHGHAFTMTGVVSLSRLTSLR